jgi:hypothetical protein
VIADVVSTWVAIRLFGAREVNPLLAWLVNPRPWTVFLIGGILLYVMTLLSKPLLESDVTQSLPSHLKFWWLMLGAIGVVRLVAAIHNFGVMVTMP